MEYKKQHIIPQCYQKAWIDPNTPTKQDPYIWQFPKCGGKGKKKSPKNVFWQSDFYTIPTGNNGRDLKLEKGLSTLESLYEGVYSDVLSKRAVIDKQAKFVICAFVAAMHSRTLSYKNHIGNQFKEILEARKNAEKYLEERIGTFENAVATLPIDKNAIPISLSEIEEYAEKPLQSFMFPKIAADIPFLMSMKLAILQTDAKVGFVSSDDPCNVVDPQIGNINPFFVPQPLLNDTIEVTLPISPKQVLFLSRTNLEGYIKIDEDVVYSMNRRTIFNSIDFIIYNSEDIPKEWFV